MRFLRMFVCFTLILFVFSCGSTRNNVSLFSSQDSYKEKPLYEMTLPYKDKRIEIKNDIDLTGKIWYLPEGITLVGKGGIIRNGIIIGNSNKIESKAPIFSDVIIDGEWLVPQINGNLLFEDLSGINSLKNLFALSNPLIHNTIIIEEGNYMVEASKNKDVCLTVLSNTDLIINGKIEICPNEYESYTIIQVYGDDIFISGNGQIVGDKHNHKGSSGEWGMGVKISESKNVKLKGITIKDCWGDCVYINKDSKDILIDSCTIDHGRRQGISIIDADGVSITNCKITNVSGTNPQFGIDIEPNKYDYVDNVKISDVTIENCEGGITIYGKKKDREKKQIGSVEVYNCYIYTASKRAIKLRFCDSFFMNKCKLESPEDVNVVYVEGVDRLIMENNEMNRTNKSMLDNFLIKKKERPILQILDCKHKIVSNNQTMK